MKPTKAKKAVQECMSSFRSRWHRHAQEGPFALRPVSPQIFPRLHILNRTYHDLGGWNVGRFLSPFLFLSGDQFCDALVCICSKNNRNDEKVFLSLFDCFLACWFVCVYTFRNNRNNEKVLFGWLVVCFCQTPLLPQGIWWWKRWTINHSKNQIVHVVQITRGALNLTVGS